MGVLRAALLVLGWLGLLATAGVSIAAWVPSNRLGLADVLGVLEVTLLAFVGWGVLSHLARLERQSATVPGLASEGSPAGEVACPDCGALNAAGAERCRSCRRYLR